MMRVLAAGDIHGKFKLFREQLDLLNPDFVLSTGDFGYWPNKNFERIWDSNKIPIYFCDGNHEFHPALQDFTEMTEVADNVFYMPRGSTLRMPDGRIVLFVGGARSIDREYRTKGVDYFPEEELTSEVLEIIDGIKKVDIVISHTKCSGFDVDIECDDDPSMEVLDEVFEIFNPSQWFFSHFHLYDKQYSDGCQWVCLNEFDEPGWYEWIK